MPVDDHVKKGLSDWMKQTGPSQITILAPNWVLMARTVPRLWIWIVGFAWIVAAMWLIVSGHAPERVLIWSGAAFSLACFAFRGKKVQTPLKGVLFGFPVSLLLAGSIPRLEALLAAFGFLTLAAYAASGFSYVDARTRNAFLAGLWAGLLARVSGTEGSPDAMRTFLESLGVSGEALETTIIAIRKSIHFVFYGFLAFWFGSSMTPPFKRLESRITLGAVWALTHAIADEVSQRDAWGRTGQWSDVLIDLAGALAFLLSASTFWKRANGS